MLKKIVLGDGVITADETAWLRRIILADGQVTQPEMHFLRELKKEAKAWSPDFEALCKECLDNPEWWK